ncbi:hypothetical protein UA08_00302 [Talaromyces atroroseus]|uniref:CipC-like antibiotic response protein n=1 Tax=Talaromyces atroroseus TaxID=1441469 RepID=A0A225AUK5_TALAT|nr:hypothetical protein UA08_00302 [Talaromyces atroroseus]OKL64620.1 hypothetical protein UA08_00302 [Talaromyces atroroseus]
MGFFNWDDSQGAHQQVYGGEQHEAKFSHELIGGAASFEAFKAFEDHQRREGKPVSHAFAKELLAGFAGAEVDKLVETKGLTEWDKIEARRHAKENAENLYDQHYGGQDQWHPDYQGPGRW